MNVRKNAQRPAPQYPSRRQYLEYKRLLGAATIGLSAVTGWTDDGRTAGVSVRTGGAPAMEPRRAITNEPPRLGGEMAVVPCPPPGEIAVEPKHETTNVRTCTSYTVKKGDTVSALAERLLGSSARWRDIVAANPGLAPETLKVGQVIVIPAVSVTNNADVARPKGKMPAPRR